MRPFVYFYILNKPLSVIVQKKKIKLFEENYNFRQL